MDQDIKDREIELRLYDLLKISAERYSQNPAAGFVNGEMMTYAELSDKVDKLAYHLDSHGVKQGACVAIWGENSPNWLVTYFAIMKIGAIAVPILPDFSSTEVYNILQHSETKVLFVSSSLYRKLSEECLHYIDSLILLKDFTLREKQSAADVLVKGDKFEQFCLQHQKEIVNLPAAKGSIEDLASIIYTSGTTGSSKGVMLTHRNLVSNVVMGDYMFKIYPNYRCLSILTMAHTLEFTLGNLLAISSGASIHYLDKAPTAAVLLPALKIVKPHFMLSVPLVIEKIFKQKVRPALTSSFLKKALYSLPLIKKLLHKVAGKKLYETFGGNLVFFGIGGAKLDADVERFLQDAKFPYAIGYGLTETAPLLAGAIPGQTKIGTTGLIARGVEVKLVNKNEKGLGEITVKGSNVMKGYYKNPELTKQVLSDDGWFSTGDLATIDSENRIFIKGRSKNMILGSSGENIYPEDIEAQLNLQEHVLESLVYEIKGQLVARVVFNYEELAHKYLHVKQSAERMEEDVKKYISELLLKVNSELNKFSKLSSIIEQKEPFEKTPTMKIKRYLYS